MANPKSWRDDWYQRINEGLERCGVPSLTSFAMQHPTWTYRELAEALGKDIAPVHVLWVERDEAINEDRFSDFAKSSLVRTLRECIPAGWGRGEKPDFHIAHSFGAWSGALGEGYSNVVRLVAEALKASAVPAGWLPDSADDPFVAAALQGVELERPRS